MPRIPYPDSSRHPGDQQAAIAGGTANVTRMLAGASEPVFQAVGDLGSAFIRGSALPPTLREISILRVGYLSGSSYETFQHEALGRFVGLSERKIDAIRSGDFRSEALSDVEAAVLSFVDDIVANVRASDATLAALRQNLDDRQIIDLILVTGYYMMIGRLLETTGVDLDAEPIDWDAFAHDPTGRPDKAAKS
jgi:4-carboxymuconolactone decarboxylase